MLRSLFPISLVFLLLAGCASTDTQVTKQRAEKAPLPYPDRILVYDFAVSADDIALDSAMGKKLARALSDTPEDEEKQKIAKAVADIVASELVTELKELGLPAERWSGPAPFLKNGYTIEGQFLTIDEGNRAKRMIVGFGYGGTEVQTLVQAYHVRGSGKKLLGEATVSAESSKKPGIAGTLPVGAVVGGSVATAALVSTGVGTVSEINSDVQGGAEDTAEAIIELLKPKLEEQGWI